MVILIGGHINYFPKNMLLPDLIRICKSGQIIFISETHNDNTLPFLGHAIIRSQQQLMDHVIAGIFELFDNHGECFPLICRQQSFDILGYKGSRLLLFQNPHHFKKQLPSVIFITKTVDCNLDFPQIVIEKGTSLVG